MLPISPILPTFLAPFLPPEASSSGQTQTLDHEMMRWVFHHCATAACYGYPLKLQIYEKNFIAINLTDKPRNPYQWERRISTVDLLELTSSFYILYWRYYLLFRKPPVLMRRSTVLSFPRLLVFPGPTFPFSKERLIKQPFWQCPIDINLLAKFLLLVGGVSLPFWTPLLHRKY